MWGHGLATVLGHQQGEKADRAAWDRRMGQHQETTELVRPEGYKPEEKSAGSDARLPAPGQRRPGAPLPLLLWHHCLLAADSKLTCPNSSQMLSRAIKSLN